jgi:hypothetical protein
MYTVASVGVPCTLWNLLVCHGQCGIYWCVTCTLWNLLVCHGSVASNVVSCAVWHLLVCHVHCGIYSCAMGSVASNGVSCAVWNLLVCHVLLTLISLLSGPRLLQHCKFYCNFTSRTPSPVSLHVRTSSLTVSERGSSYKWLVCHSVGVHTFFFFFARNCHEIFLEKLRKIPKFLRYDSQ